MLIRNLLLQLATVRIGLGAVIGGRVGQVLLWVGAVLGGVATVLVLVQA